MNKLFLLMFLCSCAVGVTDEVIEEPVNVSPPVVRVPAPKPPAESVADSGQAECIIEAYASGNCYVVKIYCKDKPVQVEVSCSHGYLFPWEYIPDPPPDYKPASRRE